MKAIVPLRWIMRVLLIAAFVSQILSIPSQSVLAKPLAALPGAFTKTSPHNGVIKQPADLTLKWASSGGATDYEYCIDDTNDKICDTGWVPVSGTSDLVSGLTNNVTYYWQVRANNVDGTTYANSNTWWSFTVVIAAPFVDEPGNYLPPATPPEDVADNIFTRHPTYMWEAVDGASSYTLEVANSTNCAKFGKKVFSITLTADDTISTYTYTRITDLAASSVYCWRVKANAKNGPSSYSDVLAFLTGNPPSTPVLLYPGANALVSDTLSPLFDWRDSELYSDGFDSYEFQIDTVNTFDGPDFYDDITTIGDITDSQYMLPYDLFSGTTYYWRVRAWNDVGDYSNWSPVRILRMAYDPPPTYAPLDGDVVDQWPTFMWDYVSDATQFRLQVSTVDTFKTVVLNVVLADTFYTPFFGLPAGTTLYWRVQALGPNGPGLWSDVITFSTN